MCFIQEVVHKIKEQFRGALDEYAMSPLAAQAKVGIRLPGIRANFIHFWRKTYKHSCSIKSYPTFPSCITFFFRLTASLSISFEMFPRVGLRTDSDLFYQLSIQ